MVGGTNNWNPTAALVLIRPISLAGRTYRADPSSLEFDNVGLTQFRFKRTNIQRSCFEAMPNELILTIAKLSNRDTIKALSGTSSRFRDTLFSEVFRCVLVLEEYQGMRMVPLLCRWRGIPNSIRYVKVAKPGPHTFMRGATSLTQSPTRSLTVKMFSTMGPELNSEIIDALKAMPRLQHLKLNLEHSVGGSIESLRREFSKLTLPNITSLHLHTPQGIHQNSFPISVKRCLQRCPNLQAIAVCIVGTPGWSDDVTFCRDNRAIKDLSLKRLRGGWSLENVVHMLAQILIQGRNPCSKLSEQIRELSLRATLIHVRVPTTNVSECDFQSNAGLHQLCNLQK